jgi:hypothetical protein
MTAPEKGLPQPGPVLQKFSLSIKALRLLVPSPPLLYTGTNES